jgi:hypothetical protein
VIIVAVMVIAAGMAMMVGVLWKVAAVMTATVAEQAAVSRAAMTVVAAMKPASVLKAASWALRAEVRTAAVNSVLSSALRMAKPCPNRWVVQRAVSWAAMQALWFQICKPRHRIKEKAVLGDS